MKERKKRERLPQDVYNEVIQAAEVMLKGGVILYPTDTIWGLGCDATNPEAVQKVYEIKQRAENKAMLVLLDDDRKLNRYLKEVPEVAWDLLESVVKPTTIIYSDAIGFASNLLGDDQSVGIRVTNDQFCQELVRKMKRPLVSTSANISGRPSPQSFAEIEQEVIDGVDYVVKYRQKDPSKASPSSIFMLKNNGEIRILRK